MFIRVWVFQEGGGEENVVNRIMHFLSAIGTPIVLFKESFDEIYSDQILAKCKI